MCVDVLEFSFTGALNDLPPTRGGYYNKKVLWRLSTQATLQTSMIVLKRTCS